MPDLFAPLGHFYSPVCDPEELRSIEARVWPDSTSEETPGIAYNVPAQLSLLNEFARFVSEINFSREPDVDSSRYFYSNDQFPCLDAEVLFCFLRYLHPKTVIEVGSGFSSLVMAEVNVKYLNGGTHLVCIEPFPRQFLIDGVAGISRLHRQKLQLVESSFFDVLQAGDVLFIDSSHVSKTGSDVNFLFFEILPRLHSGVYIHIHDIFLPDDYPKKWAIEEGRSWNEQYLVRAFLQFNFQFEIVWSSYLMATRYPEQTARVFSRFPSLGAGGSLWVRKR